MSEANEKKERRMSERQKEEKERKSFRAKVIAVVAVLVVMIVIVLVYNSNLFYSVTTAVQIGDTKYTAAEFNYYYYTVYENYANTYYQYQAYGFPYPQSGLPLDQQYYSSTEKVTWADYFESQALSEMRNLTMLYEEAVKAGRKLSKEEKDQIDTHIEALEKSAKSGVSENFDSLSGYLKFVYGKGMTEKLYRRNLERMMLANSYRTYLQESYQFTPEELKSYYDEHRDSYDQITYRSYFVKANVVPDDEETPDVDETVSFTDAMAAAEKTAKDFQAAAVSEEAFVDYARKLDTLPPDKGASDTDTDTSGADEPEEEWEDNTKITAKVSSINTDLQAWLKDTSRKEGDVTVISVGTEEGTGNKGWYVLYYLSRDENDYASVNMSFMTSKPQSITKAEGQTDEEYQAQVDKAMQDAESALNGVYDLYKSGEQTLEAFEKLYEDSQDKLTSGSTLEELGKGDAPEVLTDWLFAPERKAGDTTLVYDEDLGYTLMYFNGQGDIYADVLADAGKRSETYNTWEEQTMASYTADTKWSMRFSKHMLSLGG